MKTVETITQHQWPLMEEYKLEKSDEEILLDIREGSLIDIIKKLNFNQYIVLNSNGTVEKYNSIIENLRKKGLNIGKGNCEYGWKMPIINKKRELRIFRRN